MAKTVVKASFIGAGSTSIWEGTVVARRAVTKYNLPPRSIVSLASSPGHSQILSRSRGEKSGEGLVPLLRHGPEMVDSVST